MTSVRGVASRLRWPSPDASRSRVKDDAGSGWCWRVEAGPISGDQRCSITVTVGSVFYARGKSPLFDDRAFGMGNVSQNADQQWLARVMKYQGR